MSDRTNQLIAAISIIATIVYVLGVCTYYLMLADPDMTVEESYIRELLVGGVTFPIIGLILMSKNGHKK